MLQPQQPLPFSSHEELFDLLVPKDNLLRRIKETVDLGFVYDELRCKYSLRSGRPAEDPVRMFKYLLLKTIYDISDVDVVARAIYDLSFKYFLGLAPEETRLIDPSSLTVFRRQRLKDMALLDKLVARTVSMAIDGGIIKTRTVIVDATHTLARANSREPVAAIARRAAALAKAVRAADKDFALPQQPETDKVSVAVEAARGMASAVEADPALAHMPSVGERLNILKETLEDIEVRSVTSPDPDARVGHKSPSKPFFGYKTHIAMTPEGIVAAATVTTGEKGDGPELPGLLAKAESAGLGVGTVVGDTAYSGKGNLEMAEGRGITLAAPLNPRVEGNGGRLPFTYNKDAGLFTCPAGHLATGVSHDRRKGDRKRRNGRYRYRFDVEKCKVCPLREGCYKAGAKSKAYTVTVRTGLQEEHLKFQRTERYRLLQRERGKVEAKNSELKNVLGYGRALSYGLSCMEVQGAVAIFVANLKRILKLM